VNKDYHKNCRYLSFLPIDAYATRVHSTWLECCPWAHAGQSYIHSSDVRSDFIYLCEEISTFSDCYFRLILSKRQNPLSFQATIDNGRSHFS